MAVWSMGALWERWTFIRLEGLGGGGCGRGWSVVMNIYQGFHLFFLVADFGVCAIYRVRVYFVLGLGCHQDWGAGGIFLCCFWEW